MNLFHLGFFYRAALKMFALEVWLPGNYLQYSLYFVVAIEMEIKSIFSLSTLLISASLLAHHLPVVLLRCNKFVKIQI